MDPVDLSSLNQIPAGFFDRDPRDVAPDLLGAVVASATSDGVVAGRVVEAEAYLGADDPGSHAATKGVTKRNATMYGPPGTAYVYFTYGNHHMLNFVCAPEGQAGAVLLRALEPQVGLELMSERRGGRPLRELCNGPGKLAQALGIDLSDDGSVLGSGRISVYDGPRPRPGEVAVSGRIGLSVGHDLHLRYYIDGSAWVSRGRPGALRPKARSRTQAWKGDVR